MERLRAISEEIFGHGEQEISHERSKSDEIDELLRRLHEEEQKSINIDNTNHKSTQEDEDEEFNNMKFILSENAQQRCIIHYGEKYIEVNFLDEQNQNKYTGPNEIAFYVYDPNGEFIKDSDGNTMVFIDDINEVLKKDIKDCYNYYNN